MNIDDSDLDVAQQKSPYSPKSPCSPRKFSLPGSAWNRFRAAGVIGIFLFAVPLVLLGLLSVSNKQSEFDISNDQAAVMPAAKCFVRPTYGTDAVQIFKDIRYGQAVNPYSGKQTELLLDLYSPGYDPRPARPAVVLLHGGYLTGGDKTGDSMPDLAITLAQRGYLVASINYRLAPVSAISFQLLHSHPDRAQHIVEMVQEDAKAAVRFMRMMAKEWRIDVNRIVIGGDSAGAIAALYYAYVSGAPEGNSGNAGYSSAIHSVLAISGTLRGQAFCGTIDRELRAHNCKIRSPPAPDVVSQISRGDVPMLLWHGEKDQILPIDNARALWERAKAVGVPSFVLAIHNGGHVPIYEGLDPTKPYLEKWLSFVAGSLNLTEAQCPFSQAGTLEVAAK